LRDASESAVLPKPGRMNMLGTVLLVFAFVLACLASFLPGPAWGRFHLGWAAVACYFASLLFGALGHISIH
jgi:hypothetical protein